MLGTEVIDKNEAHFILNTFICKYFFLRNSRKVNVSARIIAVLAYFLSYY
jgi:hypothetical protein